MELKDASGRSALLVAAEAGHADVCSTLVEEGADINSVDVNGWLALHHACAEDHVETALALVRAGAENLAVTTRGAPRVGGSYNPSL